VGGKNSLIVVGNGQEFALLKAVRYNRALILDVVTNKKSNNNNNNNNNLKLSGFCVNSCLKTFVYNWSNENVT
jgi:hypothetical protein